jgi:hypothetical protein
MQLLHLQIILFSEWFLTNITHIYGRSTLFLHTPSDDAAPSMIYYIITCM